VALLRGTSLLRESQATEALAGISGRNCKLIMVKPERRGGWRCASRSAAAVPGLHRRAWNRPV
jgi:hypothetical protein